MNISDPHRVKDGFSIYFVDVQFHDTVYAFGSGLGFTDVVYHFALAQSPEKAQELIRKKLDSPEAPVKRVSASLASCQNLRRYVDPEKMAGYAAAAL